MTHKNICNSKTLCLKHITVSGKITDTSFSSRAPPNQLKYEL